MMLRILWTRTLKVKGWIWLVTGRLVTQHISEYLNLHHCIEVWNWWIPPSSSVYKTHYFPGKVQMVLSIPCIKVLYIEYSDWEFKRFFFILHLLICLSVFCHLVFIDFLWNRIDGRRTLWDRAVVAPSVSLLCLVQLRSAKCSIYPSLAI